MKNTILSTPNIIGPCGNGQKICDAHQKYFTLFPDPHRLSKELI